MTSLPSIPTKPLLAPQLDYLLVDTSSSMSPKWLDTTRAIDAALSDLKTQNLNSHLILTTFSGPGECTICRDDELHNTLSVLESPIPFTGGGTALYDAIAQMVWHLRDLDPPRCSILIVTDGEEMASRHTDLTQAKALLDWCRAKGWQVTFLGCDFNNYSQAAGLGADAATTIGVSQARLSDATRAFAKKRKLYGDSGDDINFTDDEKQQFGGYLNAPAA